MANLEGKSEFIESIKDGAEKRSEDTRKKCIEKLEPFRHKLAIELMEQIVSEKEVYSHVWSANIKKLEAFYELISTDEGFISQVEIPPGNLDVQLSDLALNIRLKCNNLVAERDALSHMSKTHNAIMYEVASLYSEEQKRFLDMDKELPLDVDTKTKEKIKELVESIPEDIRNTLNYYFSEIVKCVGAIVDKIDERGYPYLVEGNACSLEFMNDMRELSEKLKFAEEIDRGIGAQHKDYDGLDINDTSDLSDEEIDGYFDLIKIEDEDNLTLLEAEEVACMYERIRLATISRGLTGGEKIERIKLQTLMLTKGIMHHLYALNYEMINDEIDEKEEDLPPMETYRTIHPLLRVNLLFNQLFRMVREGNNISGALGVFK